MINKEKLEQSNNSNDILDKLREMYGFDISPEADIDVIDKLNNMYGSEISPELFDYICDEHPELMDVIEKEIMHILLHQEEKYEISCPDAIYDCDALYMEAIINILNEHGTKKVVTEVECGYGMIELIS